MRPANTLAVVATLTCLCGPLRAASTAPHLDAALAHAEPLDHAVVLSVDAGSIELPKDTDSVLPGASVDQVAVAYNRADRDFGGVRAVAPSTMVVIGTPPSQPDIYQGMPPADTLELFADSLTDSQWQELTSSAGFSFSDLKDGPQRQMFLSLLSHGHLKVAPWYGSGMMDMQKARDLTDQLSSSRLRLARTVNVMITYHGGIGFEINSVPAADNTDRWKLVSRDDYGGSQADVYGAKVRAEIANEPKTSQLDYADPAYRAEIDLTGVRTVGDLVEKIGKSTNTELYADARLEQKLLTIVPAKPSPQADSASGANTSSASDLLQALAYCVTGTWRQVGPAYILTDDLIGIGTRSQLWYEYERQADYLRKQPLFDAGKDLLARHHPADISWFDDPAQFTPQQLKSGIGWSGDTQHLLTPSVNAPFSSLTPAQQALVLRADRQLAHDYDWQYKQDNLAPPSAQDKIDLFPAVRLELVVPVLTKPVDMDVDTTDGSFFRLPPEDPASRAQNAAPKSPEEILAYLKSHPDVMEKVRQQNPKMLDALLHPPTGPVPTMKEVLEPVKHRAVIISAANPAEAVTDIDGAQALGFNEVWVMVFEHGKASIGGTALSTAAPLTNGQDVLDAAITEGRKDGVLVSPCVNLLTWGPSPPEGACDYNILGEVSKQAWARERLYLKAGQSNIDVDADLSALDRPIDSEGVAVDAFSPQVGPALLDLIKNLRARPGVESIVLRETSPTGYGPVHPSVITSSLPLGYNPELRLGFIRLSHMDPIDIVSPNYYTGKADVSLPMFDDGGSILNHTVPQWLKYRHTANEEFMKGIYDAVHPAGATDSQQVRLIVKARGRIAGFGDNFTTGYESWDNREIIPAVHTSNEGATLSGQQPPPTVEEHALEYQVMTRQVIQQLSADTRTAAQNYRNNTPAAIVVDLTEDDIPSGVTPIDALADAMNLKLVHSAAH